MEWWMICMITPQFSMKQSRIPQEFHRNSAAPHLSSRQTSRMKDQLAMEQTILDSATLSGPATWAGQQKTLGIPWLISGSTESKKWENLGFPELQAEFWLVAFWLVHLKYFAMKPNVSAAAYPSSEKQSVDRPHLAHFAHFRFTSGMDTTSPCQKLGHPGDILYIS